MREKKNMPFTDKHIQLAQTIDQWVKAIERQGGGDAALLRQVHMHMPTFKQLLDTTTQEQMDSLCTTYPGLYRFAKLLEALAQGIQDGTVKVSPEN
jgi:hypothetical protein